ncbi:hypothetical protein FUAX_55420 (plasmid) [Fulvitalea axinellae]|uniref:Uncharacterized protein n=1 Tax=Fulvitalea axinellae TaxID=1182444 RepID=A0AAU9DKQ8_9BACT|nr:hypothetical protein FUAX_55420 [Fulvitalea axinellae]
MKPTKKTVIIKTILAFLMITVLTTALNYAFNEDLQSSAVQALGAGVVGGIVIWINLKKQAV